MILESVINAFCQTKIPSNVVNASDFKSGVIPITTKLVETGLISLLYESNWYELNPVIFETLVFVSAFKLEFVICALLGFRLFEDNQELKP